MMGYQALLAFHILSVISWMAGMLYLPRLFVYHAQVDVKSETSIIFKGMERRLLRYIMTPAMVSAWVSGLALALWAGFYLNGWFHAKLALVLAMSGVHGYLSACVGKFQSDSNIRSSKHYRVINEVPTVLMIFIVGLVVLKPF